MLPLRRCKRNLGTSCDFSLPLIAVTEDADASARKRRKRQGKNSGKNFTEGWVEFNDKRVAKRVAEMLNGHPMGGKHRSAYHYDLWCLKYLSKFKWDHLTEEIGVQSCLHLDTTYCSSARLSCSGVHAILSDACQACVCLLIPALMRVEAMLCISKA